MKNIILAAIIGLYSTSVLAVEIPHSDNEPVAIGFSRTLQSKVLNEMREVYVSLPRSYDTGTKKQYPLYLTMDARAMFYPAASMIRSLSSAGAIPEMIVVSIKNTDRWRDLTPVNAPAFPTSGGGDRFLEFVAKELVPFLETNWRIGKFRVLSGHSLGGLMAFHSFASGSNDFSAFVALSPTLSWNETLFRNWEKSINSPGFLSGKLIYMALADETEDRAYFEKIYESLVLSTAPGFEVGADLFEETDDHHSVRVPGELAALRWIFKDYHRSSRQILEMTESEIADFYRSASKKYKQPVEFDVMQMTNAAYRGIGESRYKSKAMGLFQLAVKTWPNDAYAWSCLAEGYERTGDLVDARVAIDKAVKLGKENNFQDMPYLESIQRRLHSIDENP